MPVVAIAFALGAGAFATMELAAVLTSEGRLLAGSAAPGLGTTAASRPVGPKGNWANQLWVVSDGFMGMLTRCQGMIYGQSSTENLGWGV